MPMNSVESAINRLTSSHTDPVTHTPAFKELSVRLNALPEAVGESPLPRINHRFRASDAAGRGGGRAQMAASGLSHAGRARERERKRERECWRERRE